MSSQVSPHPSFSARTVSYPHSGPPRTLHWRAMPTSPLQKGVEALSNLASLSWKAAHVCSCGHTRCRAAVSANPRSAPCSASMRDDLELAGVARRRLAPARIKGFQPYEPLVRLAHIDLRMLYTTTVCMPCACGCM